MLNFVRTLCALLVVMLTTTAGADITMTIETAATLPETDFQTAITIDGCDHFSSCTMEIAYPFVDATFLNVALNGSVIPESNIHTLTGKINPETGNLEVTLELIESQPVEDGSALLSIMFKLQGGVLPDSTLPIRFVAPPALVIDGVSTEPLTVDGAVTIPDDNFLIVGNAAGLPGDSLVPVGINIFNKEQVAGLSLSAAYDSEKLTLVEIAIDETLTEALNCEFFQPIINNEAGYFIVGILLDDQPPMDPGKHYPVTGYQHLVSKALFNVKPDVAEVQEIPISLQDGLSDPPINNRVVIDNQSITPQLIDGLFTIGRNPVFLRGDVNSDEKVNLADPIMLMNWLFIDSEINCVKAADADDDGEVMLNDAMYLLYYLFERGPVIMPPFPEPGTDPTRDELSCDISL